ncbi:PREDICTED: TM2 domain-containing protein almondex-like [Amphimedon queenslandica]|uniref:TM2 domain-containing protein n=1 Tax=Amphimedon queenslandica TaxID=400682 RepID=A0A1X7UQC3_AMPQE|nr:PREDICTED: TM2 domain-containing protein almondex-like [Amphimedon queenslandica]|eukprot:XP_003387108.1 PREDICTED: TM2 domain-containing protein almondex-like [Amphimedon queenslandica]
MAAADRLLLAFLVFFLLSLLTSGSAGQDLIEESGSGDMNVSCPTDTPCSDLPYRCISCNHDNGSCLYGQETNFTCSPIEGVDCEGPTSFNIIATCRYCYQLPEPMTCCSTNTTCNVKSSPKSMYISNCTALDTEYCIPPRAFQKRLPCNYSTGKKWGVAFILSVTLGGFGADRFYLEQYGSAVGKLLSFGGLGVWSIIDVILVATGYLTPANGSAFI